MTFYAIFPLVAGLFLAMVVCLEHPRRGVITLESTDRILQQLRDSIR